MINSLRCKKFNEFAAAYNGSNYQINKYDLKLQNAYNKIKRQGGNV